jgi:peptidoglycan-associated lipoprotein
MSPSRVILLAAAAATLAAGGCASRRPSAAAAGQAPAAPASLGAAGGAAGSEAAMPGGPGSPFAPGDAAARAGVLQEFVRSAGDERVFFAFDSHALDAAARATLDAQANWLRTRPDLQVLLAGHADERGTREYNLALGGRRAQAARDHLISRGIAPERLRTISYGKERPLDDRPSEEGWARNRNAHTVLIDLVEGY